MYTSQIVDLTGTLYEALFPALLAYSGPVEEDAETVIPSGASITAAKEKRERLRKSVATASEDYISLSLTKREDFSSGPHPESRLVREEDELGEGEDGKWELFDIRLALTIGCVIL